MRSVLKHFRRHVRSFRIATADFGMPYYDTPVPMQGEPCYTNESTSWRLGQMPQFLDAGEGEWRDGDVKLHLSHHAQFTLNYSDTLFNRYA
jgi:hypothetical protein